MMRNFWHSVVLDCLRKKQSKRSRISQFLIKMIKKIQKYLNKKGDLYYDSNLRLASRGILPDFQKLPYFHTFQAHTHHSPDYSTSQKKNTVSVEWFMVFSALRYLIATKIMICETGRYIKKKN